ncbi:MAG: hypothetical protein ACK4R7_00995 [Fervidobacterium sp.]
MNNMKRTPIGSRKWREIADFDLKVLSFIIIFFSISTVLLTLYAFYLRYEKSKVDIIIREITPEQSSVTQKIIKTATETTVVLQPMKENTSLEATIKESNLESTSNVFDVIKSKESVQKLENLENLDNKQQNSQETTEISKLKEVPKEEPKEVLKVQEKSTESTQTVQESKESEGNKYLKDLTKFDYNLLVARMSENLSQSVLNSVFVYTVDGINALKIAKSTQNYVIDQIGNGKYCILTPFNIAPDLKPLTYAYTIMTEPLRDSKEIFKSVVNFRALGISSFSITHPNGYVICFGLFTSESSAKSFYYAQDWTELSKYGFVKGAKVTKIGR